METVLLPLLSAVIKAVILETTLSVVPSMTLPVIVVCVDDELLDPPPPPLSPCEFEGIASNWAETVTLAAGIVKLVPLIRWSAVPSLYLSVPAFNRIPESGVIVRLMAVPDVAEAGLAEILPPVKLAILTL